MTPEELAKTLQPVQNAGVDVTATAAAALISALISGYRHLGEEQQSRLIQLVVDEAWRLHDAAAMEEARIRAALVPDTSGRVH